jgi:hypothetical protein
MGSQAHPTDFAKPPPAFSVNPNGRPMDFVDFTRDCWNRKTPPAEFLAQIHRRFSSASVLAVALRIVEFCGVEEASPTPLLITYLVPLIAEDPCGFFASLDPTNPCHVAGAVQALARCGDTLFNGLSVGSAASARCAVTALLFALTVPGRALLEAAVARLALSPFFSILVASARTHCPDEFAHVSALFRDVAPFGADAHVPALQRHLATALLERRLRHPHFLTPHLGVFALVMSAIRLMDLGPRLRRWQLRLTTQLLAKRLFKLYFAAPTLVGAYVLTNVCPRILGGAARADAFDAGAFAACVAAVHAEEGRLFVAQDALEGVGVEMDVLLGEYRLLDEMGVDRVVAMFTAPPPDGVASLVQRARLCPAAVSSIGPCLLERLACETIDGALEMISELMESRTDSHMLLIAQNLAIPVCARIAQLLPDISNVAQFTPLWFFFLSLVHFLIRIGSQAQTQALLNIGLTTFLRAFISWEIDGQPKMISNLADLPPLEMCTELLLSLRENGMTPSVGPLLGKFPFLWPSALTWAIATSDSRASALLSLKPPDVRFLNQLFFHASVCISNRSWLLCLDSPDFRMLRRFCPESPTAIHFFLARDIVALVTLIPIPPKRTSRIIFSWRAWLVGFGVPEFIRALLFVLIWNVEICMHPIMTLAYYRCAASIIVLVCDGDEDQLRQAIVTAAEVIENEDCGLGVNGDGIAEFCIIINISIPGQARDIFRQLLECRGRLIEQAPPAGSAKLGFCIGLIKGGLYVPALRELIEPQVFGTPIMRQEWRSAIDYFIADSCDDFQRER